MEVTINYNGQAVTVEVTLEVYEFLDRADHKTAVSYTHLHPVTLYNSYFARGMLLYAGWLKFIIHISFLALFEVENYNISCGGAKWTI